MRRTSRIALIKIKVPMLVSGAEPAAVVGKCRAVFLAPLLGSLAWLD